MWIITIQSGTLKSYNSIYNKNQDLPIGLQVLPADPKQNDPERVSAAGEKLHLIPARLAGHVTHQ